MKQALYCTLFMRQHQHNILLELQEKIKQQTGDVETKIEKLEDAILEWQSANFIINDHCRVANYVAAERFQNWHQTVPLFQSWLSSEDKVHQSIYSTAVLAGYHDELQAYYLAKEQLQVFIAASYLFKFLFLSC